MRKAHSASRPSIEAVLSGRKRFDLVHGDLDYILLTMPNACVDAVIVDPPSGKGLFGKKWDGSKGGRDRWIYEIAMRLCAHRRVLKPGRLFFVWSYPITSHWTGMAIENAGLEIVDVFFHLFSHRRPSSPNKPKTACEMWWLCRAPAGGSLTPIPGSDLQDSCVEDRILATYAPKSGSTPHRGSKTPKVGSLIQPGIEACRIPAFQRLGWRTKASVGRHPTTVIMTHDEPRGGQCGAGCVVHGLDEMSGQLRSGTGAKVGKTKAGYRGNTYGAHCRPEGTLCTCYGDQGGASRFFSVLNNDPPFLYVNRASSKERNAGLPGGMVNEGVAVKPIELMQHLVRLANVPKDGIVLDGFAGTGSTGCACALEGLRFIGIEKDKADAKVARYRITNHYKAALP